VQYVPLHSKIIKERLTALRRSHPQCAVVSLVDLSTDMTLASSTRIRLTQERLDSLSAEAVALLRGNDRPAALSCAQGHVQYFIRSPSAEDEALCVLTPAADADETLLPAVRTAMAEIAAAAEVMDGK
jgi:hypothetical protein